MYFSAKYTGYAKSIDTIQLTAEQAAEKLTEHARQTNSITLLTDDFMPQTDIMVKFAMITPGELPPEHNHDFYEINFVESGQCIEYIDGKTFILEDGEFLLLPPTVFHTVCPVGNSRCYNLLIRQEWISAQEKRLSKADKNNFLSYLIKQKVYMVFKETDKTGAGKTALDLVRCLVNNEKYTPYGKIISEDIASKMIIELAGCKRFDTAGKSSGHVVQTVSIELILQHIRDNLDSVTLESAAKHFGYSPTHLYRIVKKHTGSSFTVFLTTCRMIRAEYLLENTDIPIGQIPQLIGLDSKEYFCRMFKKFKNITPSEYRKSTCGVKR